MASRASTAARRPSRRRRSGTSMVEMALVAPLLIFLLFGVVELGWLLKDYHTLGAACREGARVAAVGALPSEIRAQMEAVQPELATTGTRTLEYQVIGSTSWTALGVNTTGTANDAPKLAQVRVAVVYPHQLLMGSFFGFLATDTTNWVTEISYGMVTTRE